MKKALLIAAGLFLVGMVVGATIISSRQSASNTTSPQNQQASSQNQQTSSQGPAPKFSLKLLSGKKTALEDFNKGRPVVINFWASWCPPCRAEARDLEAVYRKYKNQGVMFLGIAIQDTMPNIKNYIKEFDITYPNGFDASNKIANAYGITGIPETFLITKDREIAYKIVGATNKETLSKLIEENLLR